MLKFFNNSATGPRKILLVMRELSPVILADGNTATAQMVSCFAMRQQSDGSQARDDLACCDRRVPSGVPDRTLGIKPIDIAVPIARRNLLFAGVSLGRKTCPVVPAERIRSFEGLTR